MGFLQKWFGKKSLQSVNYGSSSYGLWSSLVQEPYSGAWQKNEELKNRNKVEFYALFACISLISKDMGKMPILLKQKRQDVWVEAKTPRALKGLMERPNKYQNWQQFNEQWTCSLLLRGNTYVLKKRDAFGNIIELIILNPDLVQAMVADGIGDVFYQIGRDNLADTNNITLPASEIIHDRINAFYHPLVGISPITACALATGTGENILSNSYGFFKNSSRPSGYLSADGAMPRDKAMAIRDAWNSTYSGENIGKTALLSDGVKYTQISVSATDAQLIEQLKMSGNIVCTAFGVPPNKIHLTDAKSSSVALTNEAYYSDCLQSYIEARENLIDDALSLKDYGIQCFMELDYLIRMDNMGKISFYKEAVGSGILSPNEARAKLGYLPVKGGESPMIQQQNYSLEALAKRDASDNPFGGGSNPTSATPATSDEPNATKYIDDRYRGVYSAGTPYIKGEFVTHRGSLWHCSKDYDGDSFSYDAFTLCVKGEKK